MALPVLPADVPFNAAINPYYVDAMYTDSAEEFTTAGPFTDTAEEFTTEGPLDASKRLFQSVVKGGAKIVHNARINNNNKEDGGWQRGHFMRDAVGDARRETERSHRNTRSQWQSPGARIADSANSLAQKTTDTSISFALRNYYTAETKMQKEKIRLVEKYKKGVQETSRAWVQKCIRSSKGHDDRDAQTIVYLDSLSNDVRDSADRVNTALQSHKETTRQQDVRANNDLTDYGNQQAQPRYGQPQNEYQPQQVNGWDWDMNNHDSDNGQNAQHSRTPYHEHRNESRQEQWPGQRDGYR